MIRLQQLKLIISHDEKQLKDEIYHKLKLNKNTHFDYKIVKRSIDARKKPELYFNYIIDVDFHILYRLCFLCLYLYTLQNSHRNA